MTLTDDCTEMDYWLAKNSLAIPCDICGAGVLQPCVWGCDGALLLASDGKPDVHYLRFRTYRDMYIDTKQVKDEHK